MVPSPHIVATYTHSYILYISPCWHRNSYPHSLPRFQSYEQLHDMTLVFVFCVAFCFLYLLWCTYEHLSSVSIWTQLLGHFGLFFFKSLGTGVGWLGGDFLFVCFVFLFCCGCCLFLLFLLLLLFLWCPPSHHPSSILQARIEPLLPFFASSCAAWTFGGWKIQSSPPHPQVLCLSIYIFLIFRAIWLLKKHPPHHLLLLPLPTFSIQHREMNGNKIFSCHHPFFGLVQATPFCLKKVVCERMTPCLPLPSSSSSER